MARSRADRRRRSSSTRRPSSRSPKSRSETTRTWTRAVAAARRAFAGWAASRAAERAASARPRPWFDPRSGANCSRRHSRSRWAPRSPMRAAPRCRCAAEHIRVARDNLATYPFRQPARQHRHHARGDRRLRPDHALELASLPDHRQGRSGARGGLHGGVEAERVVAPERLAVRRGDGRRRLARPAYSTSSTGPARASGPVWRRIRRWT